MRILKFSFLLSLLGLAFLGCNSTESPMAKMANHFSFQNPNKAIQYSLTAYENNMLRFRACKVGDSLLPDNHYPIIEKHNKQGLITKQTHADSSVSFSYKGCTLVYHPQQDAFTVAIGTDTLKNLSVHLQADTGFIAYRSSANTLFTGLGHGFVGSANHLVHNQHTVANNYGHKGVYEDTTIAEWRNQAPLIVPFYYTNQQHGAFVNTGFPTFFSFDNTTTFGLDTKGQASPQLDVFWLSGLPKAMVEAYTDLTGKPVIPQMSIFGLQLTDKAHEKSGELLDEKWWKAKIMEHRAAGYPMDHVVNDNRWRAGGGERCLSRFEWDTQKYPNPAEYEKWLNKNGLSATVDFNRCISAKSAGWNDSYNYPLDTNNAMLKNNHQAEYMESRPDFTNPDARKWFWQVVYDKAANPALGYPFEGLWIDEVDEHRYVPYSTPMHNGRTWAEEANLYYFRVAQALVPEGWNQDLKTRPYVWARGMGAGAQRYATLWSGDLVTSWQQMKQQVRAMQLAGVAGFAFWGHDAGGFLEQSNKNYTQTDTMYIRWAMQMGVFSPIWKPHGIGPSRWPLDRSQICQQAFDKYAKLRYKLMAYTYTQALISATTGLPLARPMHLEYPMQQQAWQHDLQYMWGDKILVAPIFENNTRNIWLPEGNWVNFWTGEELKGGRVINHKADLFELPLFVKSGSAIPMYKYAQATAFISKDTIELHTFGSLPTGTKTNLLEDDGLTYNYLNNGINKMSYVYNGNGFEQIGGQSKKTIEVVSGY